MDQEEYGLDFSNEIVELPETEEKEIEVPLKNTGVLINEKASNKDKFVTEFNFLNFLEYEEKKKVAKVIYDLNIDKFTRNHKVINEYKNKKEEERREERKANYLNPYYNIHNYTENGYFQNVSKFEKERCMKILSLVYYAIEELGGTINKDFSLQVRGEHVELEELKDQVKHELTKEEAKQLLEYEDRKKTFSYASKPNIRKYDYAYNGKLKITCGNRKYIRENDKIKLEDKLGDIIIKLYEQSEEVKTERLASEERERIQREEEELLGKRNHTESLEDKNNKLNKYGSYYDWY